MSNLIVPEKNELQELMRGDKYYTDRTAFSNSMLARLEKDEVEFHEWYTTQKVDPIQAVFSNGQYLHDYMARTIDTSYKSECEFVFIPKLDMRTKKGKEEYASIMEGVDETKVYPVNTLDKTMIERLGNDFMMSDEFRNLMALATDVQVEEAYMRDYEGLMLKGKLDLRVQIHDTRFILDWKTSANFTDFNKKAYAYGYDRQSAVYNYISEADSFAFVVFDTVTFKRWKIVKIDKNGVFFKSGQKKMDASIQLAKQYLKYGLGYKGFRQHVL